MMGIDMAMAAAIYMSMVLVAIGAMWWRSPDNGPRGEDAVTAAQIRQCPYCAHVIINPAKLEIIRCPVCQSYMEEERHA